MKISFNELPDVPDIARSFVRFERDPLDELMRKTVDKINKGKLKLPWSSSGEYVDCRINPNTFGIEALIDGEWRDVEALAERFAERFTERWQSPA